MKDRITPLLLSLRCPASWQFLIWGNVLWGLLLSGCQSGMQRVALPAPYQASWEIPGSMSEWEEYPDVVVALSDPQLPLYLLVRIDTLAQLTQEFPEMELSDYYALHLDKLKGPIEQLNRTLPDTMAIPGLWGISGTWKGTYERDPIYGRLTLLQDEELLYQLFCWTEAAQQEKLAPVMKEMAASFRIK